MIDTELIERCQSGDEEAFEALYKATYKKAYWTAYLIYDNSNKLEDLLQDVYYECFRDIGKLRQPE